MIKSVKKTSETVCYDLVVIGGGPAGMMTASRAVERGLKVIILEKNDTLGKKLLITGGGRCNVTNAEFNTHTFLSKLGKTGNFLFSTFAQFGVKDTFDFFEKRGVKIKIEEHQRAFPADDKASSILNTFIPLLKKVEVRTNSPVTGFVWTKDTITGVRLVSGEIIKADHFVMAVGGSSHPETGSSGDGYDWLREIGHTVVIPEPSLVPISIKERWVKDLQGVTLSDIKLSVFQNDKKIFIKKGRLLFTHFGISGPTVINMSRDVGELLKWGPVTIELDLFPNLDYGMLDKKLQELFDSNKNKLFKNCIGSILQSSMITTVTSFSGINPETPIHSVFREERLKLGKILKHMDMTVDSLLGPDKSIVTSGGVACEEVDFKTMRSRLFPNLLFAGDILNIDRPSGGYSLQICWSTGWVAGSAIKHIIKA